MRCSRRVDKDDESGDFTHGRGEYGRTLSPSDLGGEGFGNLLEAPAFTQHERPGRYQLPVVVLMCDFTRPNSTNSPCLMSWHEVKTLFHEMGHAIHSMIVRTSYHNVSGTRSTTDFVKLPSILMEHFVQSPQVVSIVARHHKTGANLAFEHLDSHSQAFNSLKGLDTYRQILLALVKHLYHAEETHPQVRLGPLFAYGSTYYTYLSERVIASKIRDELFAPNPLSMQAGGVFKFKCLKYCGGNDFWQMLADVVEAENVRDGDSKSMDEAGKWGIE
ncbi:uncharacterized protein MEPE_02216 [Melanopsichium pennsylvanicum]|uniref:mitochondrial intermediate peptidase n=1 Tax=Melanopsichium pennsylvanicum TaxID=63383 RepID=A0AAJ4XJH4_9BASI|nr:uncharacterized protein MEPE_02216 [Melanopsichium pennsylvanicum]